MKHFIAQSLLPLRVGSVIQLALVLPLSFVLIPWASASTQSPPNSKAAASRESADTTELTVPLSRLLGKDKPVSLSLALSPWASASTQFPLNNNAAASRESADVTEFTVALSRLLGSDKPVRLSGVASSMKFSLPMPVLIRAQNVRLELAGTASRALLDYSQLEITVNGRVVKQLGLDGRDDSFRHAINIPTHVLRDGFNEVQLTVAQHYASVCEYPMASQLWTDIHLRESQFVVSATPRTISAQLDKLDALFDKSALSDAPPVGVFTARPPDGALLSASGLVAQGVGYRYDYVPVRLSSARLPTALADFKPALPAGARVGVVMGTFAELASYLQGLTVPTDSGPIVAVRTLPDDPTRFVVILAAATDSELPIAATAFALQRMPWPARAWVAVRDLKLPTEQQLQAFTGAPESSARALPLSALGYTTTTYSGLPTGNATMRFWNSSWQGRVQVRLHVNYSSGMAAQSALNVMANGVMHGSIPFNNTAGGVYTNYAVSMPTGSLRLGWNTLELQPVLVPQSNGGECKPFFLGNLATTIYDDSTVQTFGGSPLIRPDLALIGRDGGGSNTTPLGEGLAVQLTDSEDATLGAGLTLMAKLTQVLRTPLLRASFQVGADEKATHRLWVGTMDRLPEGVRARTGLTTAARLVVNVPLMQSVKVPVITGNDSLMQLQALIQGPPPHPVSMGAEVTIQHAPSHHAIAATVYEGDRPLTVFTAPSPEELQAGMHDVVGYGPWAQLRGGMAFWRPGEPVRTVTSEDSPFTAYTLRGSIGLWVSQYPWWSLAIVLSMIALLVALTRTVLARYRHRNLPGPNQNTTRIKT